MFKYKFLCLCFVLSLLSVKSFAQLHVQGLLHIQGEAAIYALTDVAIVSTDGLIENNGTIAVEGNWSIDEAAQFNGNPSGEGSKNVVFQNNSANDNPTQEVTGDMTADNAFFNLTIDKQGGQVALGNDIEVANQLQFLQGIIRTDLTANSDQGDDYQNEVLVSNTSPDAIIGHTLGAATVAGNYIEGQLTRAVEGMGTYDFPVGISPEMIDGAEPFQITFNRPAPASTVSTFFSATVVTNVDETRICDIGAAPDLGIPDGTNDILAIDCQLGTWMTSATGMDYDYDITLLPGNQFLANCPDAILYYVAQDDVFGDCPDFSETEGFTATNLSIFGTFDIPTVSETGISTSIEQISSTDSRVNLFPNPSTGKETLVLSLEGSFLKAGAAQIMIYDALGKRVAEQAIELTGNEQQISLNNIVATTGIYTLSMQGATFLLSRSFVVQ